MKTNFIYVLKISLGLAVIWPLVVGTASAAPPPNDNFANAATLVEGVTALVNNLEGTMETGEPNHSRFGRATLRSVWYQFTPQTNGYVELDTTGSSVDTVVAVYKGTAVNKLTLLDKVDDVPGGITRAKIRLLVNKGKKYFVAVDGFSSGGNLEVTLRTLVKLQALTFEAALRISNTFSGTFMPDLGKLVLTLTEKGTVSGKAYLGSKSFPVVSAVGVDKTIPIVIYRPDQLPVLITVTLSTLANGQIRPSAALTATMGDKALTGTAFLAPKFTAIESCPRIGTYNYSIAAVGFLGTSFCRQTISATGICKGAGYLADGTVFTYSAPVLNNSGGDVHLDLLNAGMVLPHLSLLGGKALFSGNVSLTRVDPSNTTVAVSFSWFKVPGPGLTPLGIETQSLGGSGKNYQAPPAGTRVDPIFNVNGGSVRVIASSSGLPSVDQIATLTTNNVIQVSAPNSNAVVLKLDAKTGLVTGSTKFTGQTKASVIRALLIPGTGFRGFNLAAPNGGAVTINSNP